MSKMLTSADAPVAPSRCYVYWRAPSGFWTRRVAVEKVDRPWCAGIGRRSAAAAGGGSTGSHSASRARRRDTRGGVRASHAGSRDPVPAHSLRSAAAVSRRAGRSQARPPATSSTTRLAPSVVTSCGAIRTTGLRVAPSAEPRQPDRPAPRRQPAATPGRARSSAPRPRGRRGTGPPGGRQAQRVFGNFIFGHSRQTGKCSVTFVCP